MNKIGIFSLARKQSKRCPNKMLRPFGNTSLIDIGLRKLTYFGNNAFFAGYEKEFKEKCERFGIKFIQRTKESIEEEKDPFIIYHFLKEVNYNYLLLINICLPFLKVDDIFYFLNECIDNNYDSAFSVTKIKDYFLTEDRIPLNYKSASFIDTKSVRPILKFVHALYFFNRKYFLENGVWWDWNTVHFIELNNKYELIDIDTEEDFEMAEKLYKNEIFK